MLCRFWHFWGGDVRGQRTHGCTKGTSTTSSLVMLPNNPDHGNMTRDDRDEWPDDVPVGTFDIEQGGVQGYPEATGHIMFVCPKGHRCGVLVGPQHIPRPNPDALCIWAWNGDKDKPTLTPSIDCVSEKDGKPTGGCGWHGFITNGVIQ